MNKSRVLAVLLLAMPCAMMHASEEDISLKNLKKSTTKNISNLIYAMNILNEIDEGEIDCINKVGSCPKHCLWYCLCVSCHQNELRKTIAFNVDQCSKINQLIEAHKISRD